MADEAIGEATAAAVVAQARADREETDRVLLLLAGVGVGILFGGLLTILLAPQSGQQTRHQLRESTDDTLDRLRGALDDLRVRVEDVAQPGREDAARRGAGAGSPVREAHSPADGSAVGDPGDS